ncbi:MAG TPA: bis(5'-nucleosyl)-tetraphosphatase (symmetrical) YqeK [Leptolyngbyaceae cyanobacterium M65_K2018_010]|nr:bis(5'-nucleosyl)-tetraphosphatase (symmetrical) YqeK [Leptolyngbyaceae cyanobacterium M65_K2018_010]
MGFATSAKENPRWREPVLAWLHRSMPKPRLAHSLRVETLALDLAHHHGLNGEQAAQAGLMHDLAKYFKPETLLAMARAAGLVLDPLEEAYPQLLHADVSALVAQQDLGVQEPEVLAAIANHTLGRPAMAPLSCILFLADALEPGRGDTPTLNHLRQMSYQNLAAAVYHTCDYKLCQLAAQAKPIHPRALSTRDWFAAHCSVPLPCP